MVQLTSIDQIIKREVNPFDSTTFRPGNFWEEHQEAALTVDSIHQDVVNQIAEMLDMVVKDNRTRTILLAGDSGSGKSYLLGRLKRTFNSQAFFAYIGPWPESGFIWRHTLRNTVDSLMYVPDNQKQSQMMLWLNSLSILRDRTIMDMLLSERKLFINNLKNIYPTGIYNPNEFFGVLYDLMNPDLSQLACEWLKGDDLDEESLKALRVKRAVDSEETAQKMLANFGRISAATHPIVLCFDNLDNIDRALDGFINLQALFTLNSIIHNQKLKNFLIIISVVTNTWKLNAKRIQAADVARIDLPIRLEYINLDQAESLWANRLYPLYKQAKPQPPTVIYPLTRQHLEENFAGGKTRPRYVLMLGRQLFQEVKNKTITTEIPPEYNLNISANSPQIDTMAAFQLLWVKEFDKSQQKINRMRQFSAPELINMLREALAALQIQGIQPRLLPSPTYASYSLGYHLPNQLGRIGIAWLEEPNLVSFYHFIKSCQKAINQDLCHTLYLLRSESIGKANNQGYKIYAQIFQDNHHRHLITDLNSLHYLATYHSLVNAACAGELIIGDRTPELKDLQAIIRKSKMLHNCILLQNLGVFTGAIINDIKTEIVNNHAQVIKEVKEFLLALVKTQQIMGRQVLIENAIGQFPQVNQPQIEQIIQQLCQEKHIQIIGDDIDPDSQLVCLSN